MYIISKNAPQNTRGSPEAASLHSFSRPSCSFPGSSFQPEYPSLKSRTNPGRRSRQRRSRSTSNKPSRPRRVSFSLPERPTSPHVLANLYIPLLVDARPITILSDPSGIPKAHVKALRSILQTYSDEREFIVNVKDAACAVCVKRLKEMNWIRRTYRKRSLRLRLKLFNRNVRMGRARELQLRCGHEHKLKKFSDNIFPSNCARIHNILINTGPEVYLDPFVLRSGVTNIHSYLPNLKQITLQHIPQSKQSGPPKLPVAPSPPSRMNHIREMQTFSPSGSVSLEPGVISSSHSEIQCSLATQRRRSSTDMIAWEGNGNLSRRNKQEYLECFKILEQQLPRGKRLQFKGLELYPGITRQWRKQRRKWYE